MAQFALAPFEQKHKNALVAFKALSSLKDDVPFLMIRKNTNNIQVDTSLPQFSNFDDIDTFVINASAEAENTIEYTSTANIVDLNVRDGGFF